MHLSLDDFTIFVSAKIPSVIQTFLNKLVE